MDWDGIGVDVLRGLRDEISVGKLTERSPHEVWNSKMFQEQRRRQVEGDFAMPSMCLNCIESSRWRAGTLEDCNPRNGAGLPQRPICGSHGCLNRGPLKKLIASTYKHGLGRLLSNT